MMPSKSHTGAPMNFSGSEVSRKRICACCLAVSAPPGPPTGSTQLCFEGSLTQSAMKRARSASLIGLHAARLPSPNMT